MWSSVDASSEGRCAPCGRGKHCAALLGGHVYVLGGRGAGGAVPLRDFWRYCLADGRWERLACGGESPPALQEHSAIAHGAKLYVFGGEAATSNDTPLWIYDTEIQVWRKLAGAPSSTARRRGSARGAGRGAGGGGGPRGRRGHSAHALNDCLLIFGGYKDLRGSTNELWAFHYESETWHQVRTAGGGPARHRHAAALHDNRLYVHGGQCDLRDCADLWHYDTMSRVWTQVRVPARLAPAARSGHAGLRAGSHLYIFGGETAGHPTNELWRFHFATETWERIVASLTWPSPRVDCCALLVPAPPPRAPRAVPAPPVPRAPSTERRPDPPNSLLREISKLSSFHIRRAARCSYSMLAGEHESTESLPRAGGAGGLAKSHSSYVLARRRPGSRSPREADAADTRDLAREPISVPDFADMVLPTPVLSPIEATKLVYLDSEEEEDIKREMDSFKREKEETRIDISRVVALPKSASVRFTKEPTIVTTEDESEMSTSDYASAEKVNRLSGTSLGFCNPHYLGPDVRRLGAALTPDSGVAPGDLEMQELRRPPAAPAEPPPRLHVLLLGGKEPPHLALLQRPLSMWTYRLL